ncbi:MAG TPA: ABC-F family ATP-binding cassette domain-containing protein [Acidimicrobiales bacterium]|jgi:ATPase subunit of ABC transporter with duplicated ATPase domains|nr:ABC-F family ATP-binding cassette domain-containing protein [Acidimicrobiales bacterium]
MTLQASNLRIEIGARVLLDDASFRIGEGEKVALVGPNGAGKTTLLKTLVGGAPPVAGSVVLPETWGWLAQETAATAEVTNVLAFDHLLAGSRLHGLHERVLTALDGIDKASGSEDPEALDAAVHRYSELEARFRLAGGYDLERTAETIAAGLDLDDEDLLLEVGALSGGQRRRLELARLLLAGGDLLILDEPTNHLDAKAKAFVMDFLKSSPSAVLVVSHDIELMSESIDRVFALEQGHLEQYRGTYSVFLKKRAEREASLERDAANAAKEIERLQRTADKFRQGNATAARKRHNLEQRITRIVDQQARRLPPVRRRQIKVRFPDPVRAGDLVLEVKGLVKSFGDEVVVRGVDFTVSRGEVFLVVGVNGAGKTTLLRCLAGLYAADAGTVRLGTNVTLGFYAQEHEDIRPGFTVLDIMQEASTPGQSVSELRSILAHFGLTGDVAAQEASTLSGGEKTKLSLARLVGGRANVLLLDEPTNNLDPSSREAVLAALQHFKGTVILVSHDIEFVTQLAPKHVIAMPSGRLLPFDEKMLDLVPQLGEPVAARRGA